MRTVGGHPHRLFATVAAAGFVALAVACGGGDSKSSSSTPTVTGDTGPLPSGAPADGLLVIAGPDATHAVLESALELASVKRFILTGRSMDGASFDGLGLAGDEQVWGVQPAAPAAQAEAFNAAFEEAYGYAATGFPAAAYAYDSVYVTALAAVAANSSAGAAIRDNMFFVANSPGELAVYGVDGFAAAAAKVSEGADVNYIGASGQVDMAADGGSSKGAVQTWRIIGGQIVPIETRDVDLAAEVGTEVPQGARSPAAEPSGEALTIGIIVSDDDAGAALQDAAQLAVDEINAAGGALGNTVDLAVQTLGGAEAGEAARALIEDSGADAIVGPVEAGAVTAAFATALDAEVPLVALSTAPELAAIESAGLLFRPVPSEALEMPVLANLALEMESRNVCVLYEAGAAGEVMAQAFRQAMEFKEGAVRDIQAFNPGASDLGDLLQRCLGS